MTTIRVTTKLESDTLVLPELGPLIGKTVEIRVTEQPESAIDALIDHEYHAMIEAECAADPEPVPTLEEVRAALASIPGDMTADIIADREERF
ncbi:MAG: hypothetical protein K2X87_10320 [Gemmataceae bacterium]|nr:hypothetical protein [Gemmataceae bacterium]